MAYDQDKFPAMIGDKPFGQRQTNAAKPTFQHDDSTLRQIKRALGQNRLFQRFFTWLAPRNTALLLAGRADTSCCTWGSRAV